MLRQKPKQVSKGYGYWIRKGRLSKCARQPKAKASSATKSCTWTCRLCCFVTVFCLLVKISHECGLAFWLTLADRMPFEDLVRHFLAPSSQGFPPFHCFCSPLNPCVNKSSVAFGSWVIAESTALLRQPASQTLCQLTAAIEPNAAKISLTWPCFSQPVTQSWAITTGCCFKPWILERFVQH